MSPSFKVPLSEMNIKNVNRIVSGLVPDTDVSKIVVSSRKHLSTLLGIEDPDPLLKIYQ